MFIPTYNVVMPGSNSSSALLGEASAAGSFLGRPRISSVFFFFSLSYFFLGWLFHLSCTTKTHIPLFQRTCYWLCNEMGEGPFLCT